MGAGRGPAGRALPSGGGGCLCSVLCACALCPCPVWRCRRGLKGLCGPRPWPPALEGSAAAPLEPARGAGLGPAGGEGAESEAWGDRGRTGIVGLSLPGLGPRLGPARRGLVLKIWCLSAGGCFCSAVSS